MCFYGLFQDPEKMLRRETINPTEKVYFIIKFFIICKKRWFCTEITETLVRKFDCGCTNGNYNVRQLSLGSHLTANLSEKF